MKRNGKTALTITAIAITIFCLGCLGGCGLGGRDARATVDAFVEAVNGRDVQAMKDTWDSGAAAYNTAATTAWIETYFTATDYTIASFAETASGATASLSSASAASLNVSFEFTKTSGDIISGTVYRIKKISLGPTVIFE